ncbi:MAG: hypothetical protein IJU45_05300 [Clostridia bacterium]|nr:hypothetical protein [Clostridia bacterium]
MAINIIAHRGANRYAPQNTLPAFQKAFELESDGLETDVHLTSDGVPVICHNYNIDGLSNGKGAIREMTLEQFKSYDFGSYFSDKFIDTPAPTLAELLELCKNYKFKILNLEIKPPKENDMAIVKKTIDMVKEYGLYDEMLLSSFSANVLIEAKKLDRNCKTAYLYSPDKRDFYRVGRKIEKFAREIGACALHPIDLLVSRQVVEKAHSEGVEVNVWTVNKKSSILKYADYGVDGIITDKPDFARQVLHDAGYLTNEEEQ